MRRVLLFILFLLTTGCLPANSPARSQRLPTLVPSATAPVDLEAAQRSGMLFFDAWQRLDFVEMYRLISFESQEAVPFDRFKEVYEDAHNEMTLESLLIVPRSLIRIADRMVSMSYEVTFTTNLLGEFTDTGRTLTLLIDPRVNDWRVAWSIGDIFPEMANGAYLQFESKIPGRANIYDRNGEVLADQNWTVVRVNVVKDKIPTDIPTCVASLVDVMGRTPEVVEAIFNRSGQNWVMNVGVILPNTYYERHLQLERDCAATFSQQPARRYPYDSLMPHILGNVGYPDADEVEDLIRAGFNSETIIGKSGVEKSMDDVLRGKPGGSLSLIAPGGERLRVLSEVSTQLPESIWLTIDAKLQEYVLRSIGEAYLEAASSWGITSKGASAVVMNIKTGELLALVSYPTYSGNALNPFPAVGREVADKVQAELAQDPRLPLLNRPTLGVYPAGSIYKVIDATAVTDTGILPPDEKYMCTGVWQEGNDRRYDWFPPGHGIVSTETALMQSCNPFFYTTGFRLNAVDPNILPDYSRRMGLGSLTGLRELAEASGTIPDPEWIRVNRGLDWTFSHAVSMAIGQGEVEVTPLQMARLYAGIAADGVLMRPLLIRERGILDQRTFIATPEENGNFDVKPGTLDVVRRGLCKVTTEPYGTATHIFRRSPLQDLGVCGKTGTAQSPGDAPPHAWFVGWAPRDDPQVVVLVMVENAGDGSAVAAPLVRRIMEYYFFGPFE